MSVLPESAGGMRTSGSSLVMRAISSLSSGLARRDDGFGAADVAGVSPHVEPQIGLPLGRHLARGSGSSCSARIGRTSRVKSTGGWPLGSAESRQRNATTVDSGDNPPRSCGNLASSSRKHAVQ